MIRDPDQRKDPLEAIYALDLARQMLPANPSSAIAKLTTIRTRLRLELPGFAYGGPAEPQTWPASPARPINDRFTRTTFSRDGAPVRA